MQNLFKNKCFQKKLNNLVIIATNIFDFIEIKHIFMFIFGGLKYKKKLQFILNIYKRLKKVKTSLWPKSLLKYYYKT